MEIKYTEKELNSIDKTLLIKMFLNLQNQMETLTVEMKALNDKMQKMMEQLVLANNNRFGRKTEKMSDTNQICFMEVDGKIVFFNEAEAVSDLDANEPEELEINAIHGKKTAGKRAVDMEGLPVERIDHYMTEEELKAEFGENGWKQLPDTVVKRYHFTPAKITVDEHHIGVYAGKEDGHMKRAPHPNGLLPSSFSIIMSSSLQLIYHNICTFLFNIYCTYLSITLYCHHDHSWYRLYQWWNDPW